MYNIKIVSQHEDEVLIEISKDGSSMIQIVKTYDPLMDILEDFEKSLENASANQN